MFLIRFFVFSLVSFFISFNVYSSYYPSTPKNNRIKKVGFSSPESISSPSKYVSPYCNRAMQQSSNEMEEEMNLNDGKSVDLDFQSRIAKENIGNFSIGFSTFKIKYSNKDSTIIDVFVPNCYLNQPIKNQEMIIRMLKGNAYKHYGKNSVEVHHLDQGNPYTPMCLIPRKYHRGKALDGNDYSFHKLNHTMTSSKVSHGSVFRGQKTKIWKQVAINNIKNFSWYYIKHKKYYWKVIPYINKLGLIS